MASEKETNGNTHDQAHKAYPTDKADQTYKAD
jgi:hypothetical protein